MIVALPVHIVAIIIWFGGLFLIAVVLGPTTRPLAQNARVALWHRLLSRFFLWGTLALVAIVASGIAIVQLRFGGFAHMPAVHRWNMLIGVPAIALYLYALLVRWTRCRSATDRNDSAEAEQRIARIRAVFGIVLGMGLVASIVSGAGRYAG
jgi:uncharacterized membrane protein